MTGDSGSSIVGSVSLQGGSGNTIVLPFYQYLEELSVELGTGGSWTASVTLFDPGFDDLELAIIAAEEQRLIQFTFGWDDVNDPLQRTFSGWISRYTPDLQPHGTTLTLEVMARSAGLSALDRKVRSFAEGRRISDIVAEIAALNGWQAIIEPTDAPIGSPFNSKGESDFNFIRDQLLKHARSSNGGSDYRLFFDAEDRLHFHTTRFGEARTHRFVYARDIAGDVLSFTPSDSAIFGVLQGGGNAKFTSPVSAQGGTAEVTSTSADGVERGGAVTTEDSTARPRFGSGTQSYVNLFAREPAEVLRTAQARHEHYRRLAYQAAMEVRGTHRIGALDFVQVDVLKESGERHYLSGNFQVFKVTHAFSSGSSWTSTYDMTREGIAPQPGTDQVTSSRTVSPQDVSGQDDDGVTLVVEA